MDHICGNCFKHENDLPGRPFPYGGHRSQDIFHRNTKGLPANPATLHPNGKCSGKLPGVVTGWYGGADCTHWAARAEP
jgi:hypothetical protein